MAVVYLLVFYPNKYQYILNLSVHSNTIGNAMLTKSINIGVSMAREFRKESYKFIQNIKKCMMAQKNLSFFWGGGGVQQHRKTTKSIFTVKEVMVKFRQQS